MRDRAGRRGATPTALIAHPDAELYGSDRVTLETIAALVERDWRVVLAVPTSGALLTEARRIGAETVVLDGPVLRKGLLRRPHTLLGFAVGSIVAWRRSGRLLARLRPDVVYVSTVTMPLWTARARLRRIPVLVHVHESERHSPPSVRGALGAPLRLADRVLFDSEFSRDGFVEALPDVARSSTVVPVGVSGPVGIVDTRAELDSGLRVAYIGRLSPRKGVDVAIDAIDLLVRRGVDVRLDVVGTTFRGYEWYERQLREQITDLGLIDRVTLHGFRSDVSDVLSGADVAVLPSRLGDAFSAAAAEAVLAGRPVVVSEIGGLAEVVDGFASAVRVPPGDPDSLADALQRIATGWATFRRTARTFAPIAAHRFSPASYRAVVASEIARTAHLAPEHALAS